MADLTPPMAGQAAGHQRARSPAGASDATAFTASSLVAPRPDRCQGGEEIRFRIVERLLARERPRPLQPGTTWREGVGVGAGEGPQPAADRVRTGALPTARPTAKPTLGGAAAGSAITDIHSEPWPRAP